MKRLDIKSSFLWILAESGVTLLAALASVLFAARIIGPQEFGLASIAVFVGALAETLVATPFAEALIQRRTLNVDVLDTAFTAMTLAGIGVFLILCVASPLIAAIYGTPELIALICVQAATCILLGLRGAPEAYFSRKLRFKMLAKRGIAAKIASAVVAVGLALGGAGAWSIVLANLAFSSVSTLMVLAPLRRRPRLRLAKDELRELLGFGIFTLLDALLWTVTPRLFGFMVGYFQGLRAVGQLNIAFRINDTLCTLIAAFSTKMALPIFSQLAHDPMRLSRAFVEGTRLIFMISAPIFVGLALVSSEVVDLILGPDWRQAAVALAIVSLYSLFNFSRLLAHPMTKALGKPALLVRLHLVGLGFVSVATVATASYGFEAQLAVWGAFGAVFMVTSVYLLKSASGIGWREQLAPLCRPLLACLGMALAVTAIQPPLVQQPPLVALAVKLIVGVLAYGLLLVLVERRSLSILRGRLLLQQGE